MLQVTEAMCGDARMDAEASEPSKPPTPFLLIAAPEGCEHAAGSSEQDLAPNLSLKKGGGDKPGKKLQPCQQGRRDPLVSEGSGGRALLVPPAPTPAPTRAQPLHVRQGVRAGTVRRQRS